MRQFELQRRLVASAGTRGTVDGSSEKLKAERLEVALIVF